MIRRIVTTRALVFRIALIALIFATELLFARQKSEDDWQVRENLVLRLGSEWYKIGVLSRELASISDVLSDIRDLELFPSTVTGFSDETLVKVDRRIEYLEKRNDVLSDRVKEFRGPLADAMAILREMVVGEPVESMFDVLEMGDMKRINEMLLIKHQIDTLWLSTDSLLTQVMTYSGIPQPPVTKTGAFEEEFFKILRANIGEQSEIYYDKLSDMKTQLIRKAGPREVEEMFRIEKKRIIGYLTSSQFKLASKKILDLRRRYETKIQLTELDLLLAKVQFSQCQYGEALKTANKLPLIGEAGKTRTLYRMQSLYILKEYDSLEADIKRIDFNAFQGAHKNVLLWVSMESALELGKTEQLLNMASFVDKSAPYALNVMHVLGRAYVRQGDMITALSIFESALKFKTKTEQDMQTQRAIRALIAQTNYEMGKYEKALKLFFPLLNEPDHFDKALFGILWCYINLGENEKAESSLKKLINQAPSSPLASEAILVLAKWYARQARKDWRRMSYLVKEEQKLAQMLDRLAEKEAADTSKTSASKYSHARNEIRAMLARMNEERRPDYNSISNIYDKVEKVCNLIIKHYNTGTFQEVRFSEKREKLLLTLDSLTYAVKGNKSASTEQFSDIRETRMQIKKVADKARVFIAENKLERYRWEREHIDWLKSQIQSDKQKVERLYASAKDTVSRMQLNGEKMTLEKKMDSLLVYEEQARMDWHDMLTGDLRELLKSDLDSADQSYFRYHLAELTYQNENAQYARAYEIYETAYSAFEMEMERYKNSAAVERPFEPVAPVLNHDSSLSAYREVLNGRFTYEIGAAAHYSIAWCFNDLARFDSAIVHMETVSREFAKSVHAPQAWMYCGEYRFDKGTENDLRSALQCYQAVMKYPESEWFDEALYKLAWTQYRLSNPEKAISSFLALVDLGAGNGIGKSVLEKESMDYVAISFSETDLTGEKGLQRATAFVKKMGDQDRGGQILHRLATVYREQGRYDMAKRTYRTLLRMYPSYPKNPVVESELIAVLERDLQPDESNLLKMDYFRKYSHLGGWASSQNDPSIKAQADSAASKQLYDVAISYHQIALQKNDSTMYANALNAYDEYIRAYPSSNVANECHYNLAEIQFSLGNYKQAAQEYIAVSKRYPDSKYRETAAWNAIVASQNLLKIESGKK